MTNPKSNSTDSASGSFKMLRAMVGIGVLCALLIVMTFETTYPRIQRLQAEALQEAVFKVLPGTSKTKTYELQDGKFLEISGSEKSSGQLVYVGFNNSGKLVGVAVEAKGQGYAGTIRILYGYDPGMEKIIGFHVLESLETPGLGDKIEKDGKFLANFRALDVSLSDDKSKIKNPVKTVKRGEKNNDWEIDGITGATISSRAIGNIIRSSTDRLVPVIYENIDSFKP